ncbi:MAG TPA: tyrosine-type recombinase/integrase [Nitrospiraceae bacterium]|nr:tyrosine-type recombinase/integrase [Nitrospiraceae bacterium]
MRWIDLDFVNSRWQRIRTAAGLPDVTIHDLRRTCASWLACHGDNLAIIGNVLNHSTLAHTAIYARLNISPVTRALEEYSAQILPAAINPAANQMIAWPIAAAVERMEWPGGWALNPFESEQ